LRLRWNNMEAWQSRVVKSERTSDTADTAIEYNSSNEYSIRTTPHFNPVCRVSTRDGSAF
jgi:hypothetical protein